MQYTKSAAPRCDVVMGIRNILWKKVESAQIMVEPCETIEVILP
jgi:hypothetical protein